MRKILIFLLIMLIGNAIPASATKQNLTQQQALEIARTECSTPAQYFYMDDDDESSVEWKIFIDAAPLKNWEHPCYVISVPKTYESSTFPIPYTKEIRMTAPDGNFSLAHSDIPTPLDYIRREPYVYHILPEDQQAIANSTYALIINGGINKMSNHRRYWNDCAFIYELLSGRCGVPQTQIFPIMADGADPALDTRNQNGTFISQSLDINYDGQPEIQLSATKANIQTTLQSILSDIGQDDHLLIFVVNGGGTVDSISQSYINLWGTEKLYDYELAQLLTPFTAKKANVSVILGQSFAGGFIDNLASVGCVVSAACDVNESSSAISSGSYDEFVYHWTSAMLGRTPDTAINNAVNANANGDSFVSMLEAYNYALNHSGQDVSPQYLSTPAYVGEDLGCLHRARTHFIYIRDNDGDLGDEPNLTKSVYNQSPSIWVRNARDDKEEDELPFMNDNETAYIYVKIDNRGKNNWTTPRYLHTYWSFLSPTPSLDAFKGQELYLEMYTGMNCQMKNVGSIPAGECKKISVAWDKPDSPSNFGEVFHYSVIAKLMNTSYDNDYSGNSLDYDIQNNSGQAMRDLLVITGPTLSKYHNILIRNNNSTTSKYSLELVPAASDDEELFKSANVQLMLSNKIYTAWRTGGFKREGVDVITDIKNNPMPVVSLRSNNKLKDITLSGNDLDFISFKFNFTELPGEATSYNLNLIQRDDSGRVLGIVPVEVIAPSQSATALNITPTQGDEIGLTANVSDFESVTWYNSEDELIAQSDSITITPSSTAGSYKAVGLTADGEMAVASVSLESLYGIKSVTKSSANTLLVELMGVASNADRIEITSTLEGSTESVTNLSAGESVFNVTLPELTPGVYTVAYIRSDNVIATKNIVL